MATGYLLHNQDVADIAKNNHVSVAQLAIKYCLQHNIVPLPKAINPTHIEENTNLDFVIPDEDMETLDSLVDTAPGEDHNE